MNERDGQRSRRRELKEGSRRAYKSREMRKRQKNSGIVISRAREGEAAERKRERERNRMREEENGRKRVKDIK